jgi:predicted RNA binding protein YcfA (HicA-like mRNA interferase family)
MRLPRDMDAATLIKALARIGYTASRQTGSHIRLTAQLPQQCHLTVPNHSPLKIGTLNSILSEVSLQQRMSRDELLRTLF